MKIKKSKKRKKKKEKKWTKTKRQKKKSRKKKERTVKRWEADELLVEKKTNGNGKQVKNGDMMDLLSDLLGEIMVDKR